MNFLMDLIFGEVLIDMHHIMCILLVLIGKKLGTNMVPKKIRISNLGNLGILAIVKVLMKSV